MIQGLPSEVERLFWGDDLIKLDWQKHQDYIIQTILEKGDIEAVRWLFERKDKRMIKQSLSQYKLSKLSKNFWQIYL